MLLPDWAGALPTLSHRWMPNTGRRWATRHPPRPKVETFRSRCRGMPSCISMKPWIPARILAHLQIAAAAHLGGDLGRDAARLAFIGIETNDAERIGVLAG